MGYDATTKILELFQDPLLSRDAAAVLSVIAEDSDRVLSKENFATIRVRPVLSLRVEI
jgi:DNA repair/transcription protein MET18/MMS19